MSNTYRRTYTTCMRCFLQKEEPMKPLVLVFGMLLAVSLWMTPSHGHEATGPGEQLGQVHFAVSCHAAAQAQFDRAVALLHSF